MYFRGIATAVPPARYTKADCLAAFEASEWLARLDPRSHWLARAVLQRDNGDLLAVFTDKWALRMLQQRHPSLNLEPLVAAQLA